MEIMTGIPKSFWKYYDLFRRSLISLEDFSKMSGIPKEELLDFLFIL